MSHDEMIAVIAASKNGQQLQWRLGGGTVWAEANMPSWNFAAYEYRIKPEPRIIWVNEYPHGLHSHIKTSKEDADEHADINRIACRKFVEVIE